MTATNNKERKLALYLVNDAMADKGRASRL
jgi:hypothetical protein